VKMVAEYLHDARLFERLADQAKDPEVKAALERQAKDYRALAVKRAKQVGLPTTPEAQTDKDA